MASPGQSMRAFFGIPLNEDVRKAIGLWQKGLQSRVTGVRWIAPENWHVTLRFLGGITQETLEKVQSCAAEVALASKATQLEAVGSGLFRNLSHPRIAWIGVEGNVTPLEKLYRDLESTLEGLDIEPADTRQKFHPHITIGRIRHPRKVVGLEHFIMAGKDKHFGEFPLETLTLFKSELTSKGARYSELGQYCLGG